MLKNELFLSEQLKSLSKNLSSDIKRILKTHGVLIQQTWLGTLELLSESGKLTVTDIAKSIGLTHPGVIQIISGMEKKELVRRHTDVSDRRRKYIELTEKGSAELDNLKPLLAHIEESYLELFKETDYNALNLINDMEVRLREKSMYSRVREKEKTSLLKNIEVVPFRKEFKKFFKSLNVEWLEKYFSVEPEDESVLNDPESTILNDGGEIFFALIEGKPAGTCAVIRKDKQTYELAKMAVTESARGRQAGMKLTLTAIGFAVSRRAKILELETSVKLTAAINLYRKVGFKIVPSSSESKYKRRIIRMRLSLVD